MQLKIIVQQLRPGDEAPGDWYTIGKATTWREAKRIARREYDPVTFGIFQHPTRGLKCGTIRAITPDEVRIWDPGLDEFIFI